MPKEKGELPDSADPAVLAQLASATIHTIAIRARARVPRKELEAIVKGAIDVMVRGESSSGTAAGQNIFQLDLSARGFPIRPRRWFTKKERHDGKSKGFRILGIARWICGGSKPGPAASIRRWR